MRCDLDQRTKNTTNAYIQAVAKYFNQYQANLDSYLSYGTEQATSLLEQVFQRLKKTTSNYRGARFKSSMQQFVELYRFFWNTEPLKLKYETKTGTRSLLARLGEHLAMPIPFEVTARWWDWIFPMEYHTYRKQVQTHHQRTRFENLVSSPTRELKAKHRWKYSRTLARVSNYLTTPLEKQSAPPQAELALYTLFPRDRRIYQLLRQHSAGLERLTLQRQLKLPQTVLYESLERLESLYLIIRKRSVNPRGGKAITVYLALQLEGG